MAMTAENADSPLSWRGYASSWIFIACVTAPLWIWQDGRYGLLKSLFFALFFAWTYGVKRNTLDVAVFALIMTGLQLFSRQVVDYHQLVIGAHSAQLTALAGHAALTLASAWLMGWLFDLRGTPGPTYTRLAAYYMIFYFGEFVLHAAAVMIIEGLPFGMNHPQQFILLLLLPMVLWWLGSKIVMLTSSRLTPFKAGAAWKRRFRDFDNTRAVVFSCLALFIASIVWFGFVHFTIAKLGATAHYEILQGCASPPDLTNFMKHSLSASLALGGGCVTSSSLLSRGTDYLQVIISLFLFLVLVQALALAYGAPGPEQPPKRPE
ncbi:conserved membrane hypothetical protein [Rhodospirillaceae bacterium LM-1]|nr:conserved membrane hypothetical protein [Rhodospirillaceae bacterium LM-1]